MKKHAVVFLIFLLMVYPSSSLVTFTYNETEKVAIDVMADDPDRDALSIGYPKPLNSRGEWKTAYGDSGIYDLNITVTDGDLSDSELVRLIINRKEEPPLISRSRPLQGAITVDEGKDLLFSVKVSDLNKDALHYRWTLDGSAVSEGSSFAYALMYGDAGTHNITVQVSDGVFTTVKEWVVEVRDVDLDTIIFGGFQDISYRENEVVPLSLPDFGYYRLDYNLSWPGGQKAFWKAGYESAGQYEATLSVFGRNYDNRKKIRIIIENVDRQPVFAPLGPQLGYESKQLQFSIRAADPDNDAVQYSLANMPDGASFAEGIFTWIPDYDAVTNKRDFLSETARDFHLLSKIFELEARATGKNLTTVMKIPITIINSNRHPVLDTLQPAEFKEGDIFTLPASASDPDRDALAFSFKGPFTPNSPIGYDMAGRHSVKVVVSDGFLEDTQDVEITILDTNRPPVISGLSDTSVRENQTLSLRIVATDPDNDRVFLSLESAPDDAAMEEGVFTWTPGFDAAKRQEPSAYPITIKATDGTLESRSTFSVAVSNVNRAPEVDNTQEHLSIKRNTPVVLDAGAADPDGDELAYSWSFGLFEDYDGGATHQRVFTTKGTKKATVRISDGQETIEKTFDIVVA